MHNFMGFFFNGAPGQTQNMEDAVVNTIQQFLEQRGRPRNAIIQHVHLHRPQPRNQQPQEGPAPPPPEPGQEGELPADHQPDHFDDNHPDQIDDNAADQNNDENDDLNGRPQVFDVQLDFQDIFPDQDEVPENFWERFTERLNEYANTMEDRFRETFAHLPEQTRNERQEQLREVFATLPETLRVMFPNGPPNEFHAFGDFPPNFREEFREYIQNLQPNMREVFENLFTPPPPPEYHSRTITAAELIEKLACPICLNLFEWNVEYTNLICGHLFHHDCVKTWVERHHTCPTCRQNV